MVAHHPTAGYIHRDLFLCFRSLVPSKIYSNEFLLSPCSCSSPMFCNFSPHKFFQFLPGPALHFIFFAFSLARFTLLNCSFPLGTTALYRPILKLILRRCSLSAVFSVLFAINDCECSDMLTNITFSLSFIVFRFIVLKLINAT